MNKSKIWSCKERTFPRKRSRIHTEELCNIQKTQFWGENRICEDIDCGQFAELFHRSGDLLEGHYFKIVNMVGPVCGGVNSWLSRARERHRRDCIYFLEFTILETLSCYLGLDHETEERH